MRIPFDTLFQQLKKVLLKYHFSEERADVCARLFAEASRDGVYTHGLNRFPRFIKNIRQGIVKVEATPNLIQVIGAIEQWDGQSGPGNLNAHFCMQRAISLAGENGMAVITLRNTNHWMRGGSYGWQAAEAGCIGLCWTNTQPNMPAWGTMDTVLGNNPLIMAIPRKEGHIVLDTAMTQFSFGKLESYRRKGEQLPVPGGFDEEGNMTTDPATIEKSFKGLPIGYWKGSGLSLALDLIVSVLALGKATWQIGKQEAEYGLSQIFIAINLAKVVGEEAAQNHINSIIDNLHHATPTPDNEKVYYPGERTLLTRQENMEKGVPVEPQYWEQVLGM
jgi:3-dehydro-L-gulonate 2-dehydrogenase